MCAHEYPGALMSMVLWCHECSWVLMSAHSLVAPCSQLLLCSDECSLLHGTKLMSAHGCSWVFNGNQEHSWLLLAAYEYLWVLMSAHDCSLVALMRSHELGAMNQWALMRAQEHGAMRLWALISTLEYSWHHRTILMSAPGYSWVLMSTHERLWELMNAHDRTWLLNCFIK